MNFTFTEAKRFRPDSSGGEDEEDSCDEEISGYSNNANGLIKMPRPGKKTRGRVKVRMELIKNKLRRYTTFSKRKTGIMKKAYELATLTGTQVMVLVASETGHVYTFATQKLQPMITSEAGKALIQTCLNSPEPGGTNSNPNLRMTETGYEEQDLSYTVEDREGEEEEGEDDIYEREAKPQVEPLSSRGVSPDSVLPPSTPPLMTIPPHVLSQLLTTSSTTSTTSMTSMTSTRHTAFTPVTPGLFSASSTVSLKQQQQPPVVGRERRENPGKRRNILVSSPGSSLAGLGGPPTYSLPQTQSQAQSEAINIQEILAHLKHPPQSEAGSGRNKKL